MTYKENITAILECYFTGFKKEIIDSACNRILEQEPKTGHWIDREVYDADRWKCSECGRTEPYKENYCSNCGADMRGGQDE